MSTDVDRCLTATPWATLTNIAARPTNHLAVIAEPSLASNRFYRLVTPQQP